MNTAKLTAKVGYFGSYWEVNLGGQLLIAKTQSRLIAILTGRSSESQETVPEPVPLTAEETVEQFLARGGKVTKVHFPVVAKPIPPAVPEPKHLAISRITLESLGLAPKVKTP